jgi:DNA modification methylase
METNIILNGESVEMLKSLPDKSVHCCVTSPPYYGLRDYGTDGQIGREDSPEQYISRLVSVFREVWRVVRTEGTLWLNISDSYAGSGKGWTGHNGIGNQEKRQGYKSGKPIIPNGCKQKDLIGIPWLLAFALRDDGWYLRNDIIWEKANPMPESVRDRCSRSYEHVFLLTKSKKYYYDWLAIAEPTADSTIKRLKGGRGKNKYADGIPGQSAQGINSPRTAGTITDFMIPPFRNKRDVWRINTVPYKGAHFAAFPPKLAETCILAGCPPGGVVLDPFFGSGTTGLVALQTGRRYIGIDINAEYCRLADERIAKGV